MRLKEPSESEDAGLRAVGEALRNLRQDLPPEGLASTVASELAKLPPPRRSTWRRLWANPQQPRTVWAYRAAILVVLLGILGGIWRHAGQHAVAPGAAGSMNAKMVSRPQAALGPLAPVTFVFYAPKAKSVSLVGTFNDWDPEKTPMNRGKDGTWSVQVSLPQGRHEYLFLVDGSRYESDPNALELRQDGMGNENAVLRL
jgi:hypothetical protein